MSKSRLTVSGFARRFLPRLMVVLAIFWGGGIALSSVASIPSPAVIVKRQVSTRLYDNFHYVVHSDQVSMDQISPWMGLAMITAEDQKFPGHWGFDIASIEQTLAHNERSEDHTRGTSTISQQAAKSLFLWDGRNWVRKGLEAGLTLEIETVWSRKCILTVYLDVTEFGDGVFGVEAATQRYFHRPVSKLTRSEAALLATILPNPLHFKVFAPSGYVRSCQTWILRQMYQLGGEPFMQQHQLD